MAFFSTLPIRKNLEFYIVEVELAKHDFYNHIFPQIIKFFGFYKNPKNQNDLIEKIFTFINNDNDLKRNSKIFRQKRSLQVCQGYTIESSQNILLIIDADKKRASRNNGNLHRYMGRKW